MGRDGGRLPWVLPQEKETTMMLGALEGLSAVRSAPEEEGLP